MPPKASWIMRLPEIISQLSALEVPVVDRAVCEMVFDVKRRRAITLMQQFGGYRSGNTILLDRNALIADLHRMQASDEALRERRRKDTFAERLAELDRYHLARRIRLPVARDVWQQQAHPLPEGISLRRGKLTVSFNGTEELFARLFALVQAAVNDFEGIREIAETHSRTPDQPIL